MVGKAIKPIMESKGYTIEVVEFNDYVQPNKALANGSIDANLFQHIIYLKKNSHRTMVGSQRSDQCTDGSNGTVFQQV